MTDGEPPVEQKTPSAEASAIEPAEKKSFWERLKPVWWMRGVLGALALVGLLDQIGWVREKWLPLVHAIATRWHDLIGWLSKTISVVLPFNWEITSSEGHYLAVMFALILPAMIPAFRVLLSPPRRRSSIYAVSAFITLAGMPVLGSLMPGESVLIGGDTPVFGPLLLITSAIALLILPRLNKPYFKALFITLTFMATLEVLYLAPFVQETLQPFVDSISGKSQSAFPS